MLTKTVNTLRLVLANDDTGESSTSLEQEYGICVTSLSLLATSTRATVVARVGNGRGERLACSNPDGGAEVARRRGGREHVRRGATLAEEE